MPGTLGLLLAAGAGRRMGGPKALVRDETGVPWVVGAARALAAGGCDPVVVVVGARAGEVGDLLVGEDVRVVETTSWAEGMGASLRAGLLSAADDEAAAVLVHLVDLPDVGSGVVRRLVAQSEASVLARATYDGVPGHPVLVGRDHWAGVAAAAVGDRGARDYLAGRAVAAVECADLATGLDVDEPGPMLGR